MKKLLVATVAALSAVFSAEAVTPHTTTFDGLTAGANFNAAAAEGGSYYWYFDASGGAVPGIVTAGGASSTANYLDIATVSPLYRAVNSSASAFSAAPANGDSPLAGSVYADMYMKFTACEETPEISEADAKLAVWMQVTQDVSSVETNLMVAGAASAGSSGRHDFKITTIGGAALNAESLIDGNWHRMTVKALPDVAASGTVPAFVLFIDGQILGHAEGATAFSGDLNDFGAQFGKNCLIPSMNQTAAASLSSVSFTGIGAVDEVGFTNGAPVAAAADPVAKIGSTIYLSLQAAIDASSANDTITLLANTSEAVTTTGKSFILAENGNTFSGTFGGSGTVRMNTAPADFASASRFAAGWTGTFQIGWAPSGKTVLDDYGIAGSTVEFVADVPAANKMWLAEASATLTAADIAPNVKISANVVVGDGLSGTTTKIPRLSGAGTFTISTQNASDRYFNIATIGSDFTGTLVSYYGAYAIFEIGNIEFSSPAFGTPLVKVGNFAERNLSSTKVNNTAATLVVGTESGQKGIYLARAVAGGTPYLTVAEALDAALAAGIRSVSVLDGTSASVYGWTYDSTTQTYTYDYRAYIGETGYYSLVAAIEAAGSAETSIRLVRNSSETVSIPANVAVKVADGIEFSGAVSGAGEIWYTAVPVGGCTFDANDWTGTVVLDYAGIKNAADISTLINSLGTANSTVEIGSNGSITGDSYINANLVPGLKVTGYVSINNGSTDNRRSIPKLTGDGVFVFGDKGTMVNYSVGSLENWNGVLTNKSANTQFNIVSGFGTVVYSVAPTTPPTIGSSWQGVVELDWTDTANSKDTAWVLDNYGVAGSTVQLDKSVKGYLKHKTQIAHPAIAPDIALNGVTLHVANGYSNVDDDTWTLYVASMPTLSGTAGSEFKLLWDTTPAGGGKDKYAYYSVGTLESYAGSLYVGPNMRLKVGAANYADAAEASKYVAANTRAVPVTLDAKGKLVNSDGDSVATGAAIPVTVDGTATGDMLVYATIGGNSGLYKAVAKVGSAYYATYADAAASGANEIDVLEYLSGSSAPSGYVFNGDDSKLLKLYTVTFVDYDDTVLQAATQYAYGTAAANITVPANPTRAADTQYTYTFAGWTPTVVAVSGDATYTATYTSTVNSYTITFANYNGTALQSSLYAYGETPAYSGATPTKPADDQYTYTFSGWSPAIVAVSGEATYIAQFDSNTKVAKPTAVAGLVYNGEEQTGVAAGTGYAVSGNTGTASGDYTATATLESGYVWSDGTTEAQSVNWSIAKRPITVTVAGKTDVSLVYDGTEQSVPVDASSYTLSCGDSLFDSSKVGRSATVAKGTTVKANYPLGLAAGQFSYSDPNVDATFSVTDGTFAITAKPVTVTVSATTDEKTYTGSEQSFTPVLNYVSSETPGSVLFNASKVTFSGTATLTRTDVGTTQQGLAAGQFGYEDANLNVTFVIVENGDGALTITKKSIAITVVGTTDTSLVYNGAEQSVTVDASKYDVSSEDPLFGGTKVVRTPTVAKGTDVKADYALGLAAGQFSYNDDNVTATFSVTDGTFAITAKPVTVTVSATTDEKTYTGSEQSFTPVLSYVSSETAGSVLFDASKVTFSGTETLTRTDVGTTQQGLAAGQFGYSDGNLNVTFVIGSDGALTITAAKVAVPAAITGLVYDGTEKTGVASGTGYTLAGDKATAAGSHTATATLAANYEWDATPSTGTKEIVWSIAKKAATITVTAASKTYGTSDPAFTGAVEGLVSDGDLGEITYSRSNDAEDVGTYNDVLTASYTANANYEVTVVPATFTINKAALTVTANAKTITYGDAPANNGVSYSGFVGSDTASSLSGTLAYTYSYSQFGDVGNSYTITPSGLTSGNYAISYANGTLTVEPKTVGLEWSADSLTYNGTAQAPTATATGLVNGDEIGVTVAGAQTDVGGPYKIGRASCRERV